LVLPVVGAMVIGGPVVGLFAVLIGFFLLDLVFIPPYGSLTVKSDENWLALIAYIAVVLVVAVVVWKLQQLRADSARHQHEAAETLSILDTLQSTSPVGFSFVDPDFRFVRVNEKAAAIDGVSVQGHIGRTMAEVIPQFWSQLEPSYRGILALGEPILNVEVASETAEDPGRLHYWLESCYPVRVQGAIIGVGAVFVDVTEQKEAERVRLEAEAERVKAEGEKAEAERVRLEAEVERVKAEGEKAEAERVRLEAEAQHVRLEAQLHQSQRMESLGQLAGGVAHDFNNLLAVILNYASFVAEELSSATATPTGTQWEEPLKDVKQIQLAAERASLLTHQLLAFARRGVVQARALSLNSVITRMEQILRRTIGEQVELVISLAPSLPMAVADPGQIEQIVLNLVINARDAMPAGGTLSIETSTREVTQNESSVMGVPEGLYVRLRVGDTGVGMSAEVRERAFEPFFTTKPRGEGSGLGLATVYGIVSQSGGYTKIYSDEGVGTSISILLPAAKQGATQDVHDERVDRVKSLAGTETVLVVDDEEALREVTRRILTRSGYTVITASGGAQAIELATSHVGPIDLVLTDVIMPKMQGPAVANEMKKLRPGIRVLFMSGHAQPVLEAEAVLGTEFVLVEKPFDQVTLLENVRKALDRDE
jgi:PAS domain S-box-containing protein